VPNIQPHYGHIPLHRLWAFAKIETDLSLSEHLHVLECEKCRAALQACLQADTFGAVLKQLQRAGDGNAA
jgi:hypothetical protein